MGFAWSESRFCEHFGDFNYIWDEFKNNNYVWDYSFFNYIKDFYEFLFLWLFGMLNYVWYFMILSIYFKCTSFYEFMLVNKMVLTVILYIYIEGKLLNAPGVP